MERLKRLREPAALVIMVALGLQIVLIAALVAVSGAPIEVTGLPLAYFLLDPALLVLLTGLVIACWVSEPTPHARGLTIAALVLTAGSLVAGIVLAVGGLMASTGGGVPVPLLVRSVPSLATGVIALGTSISLLRRLRPGPAPVPELPSAEAEPEPVDPLDEPTWTSDAAVGTVWRRAGDAGSQRPATSWDTSGQSGGWSDADADPDTPVETTRRPGE